MGFADVCRGGVAACLILVAAPAAMAAQSAYTTINIRDCTVVAAPVEAEDGPTYVCNGYGGIPVLLREGDLRWFVAYGANPLTHVAIGQTVAPFNSPFRNGDDVNPMVIEWRLDDQGRVYATIQRFYITSPEVGPGSYLIVNRLFPGNSCRIAQIAAHQIPDANVLARQFADQSLQFSSCPGAPQQFP